MQQRLQKIIAASGLCSRRKAEDLIASGRVEVDGQIAQLGDQADAERAVIMVDGRTIAAAQDYVYCLIHKPLGVVTTLRDPQGRRTVTELVQDLSVRLFPVGRLDINTSGLLLLTNDGELAHQLAHPSHEVVKRYLVKIQGRLSDSSKRKLIEGVVLEDGLTAPASIENVRIDGGHTWFELCIHEGRNRQVRRMCEALGYQVSRLIRTGYAFLSLGDLKPGEKRLLSKKEIQRLKDLGG